MYLLFSRVGRLAWGEIWRGRSLSLLQRTSFVFSAQSYVPEPQKMHKVLSGLACWSASTPCKICG